MNQKLLKPAYQCKPIGSVASLAKALGLPLPHIVELANRASLLYREAKPIVKPDGSIRQPLDAKGPLKELHRRLKERVFSKVDYPRYLTGSIRDRDYVVNAELHVGSSIIICEDITNFFPTVSSVAIYDIWHYFFCFPREVAEILTSLTTKDGCLPQGAIPSSYLANLALWRKEPQIQQKFEAQGIVYSRYVDDIAISSKSYLDKETQTAIVSEVYGMLSSEGLKAKRKKHETHTPSRRMLTTKLVVNKKVSLPDEKRSNLRAAVFQVEELSRDGLLGPESLKLLSSVSSKIGQMKRLHPTQGASLQKRLRAVREQQEKFRLAAPQPSIVQKEAQENSNAMASAAPW
jgi:retron-type reverse transcriptase